MINVQMKTRSWKKGKKLAQGNKWQNQDSELEGLGSEPKVSTIT